MSQCGALSAHSGKGGEIYLHMDAHDGKTSHYRKSSKVELARCAIGFSLFIAVMFGSR